MTRERICDFGTQPGETVNQALRREHKVATDKLEKFEELLDMIKASDGHGVNVIRGEANQVG